MTTSKVCNKCLIEKPIDLFGSYICYKLASKPRYIKPRCKSCESAYNAQLQKKLRATNPEYKAKVYYQKKSSYERIKNEEPEKYQSKLSSQRNYYTQVYYPNNKDKVAKKCKLYCLTSLKDQKRRKEYAEKHRDKYNDRNRSHYHNMKPSYIVGLISRKFRRSDNYIKGTHKLFYDEKIIELYKSNLKIKRELKNNKI